MNVLALHFQTGSELSACQIYRTNIPFYALRQHGWRADWENWDVIREQFNRRGRSVFIDLLNTYDLFTFPRLTIPKEETTGALAALFQFLRSGHKRIVYEVDDDFTNEHRDLVSMGVRGAVQLASWCDAITVTTQHLGDLMSKRTGRKSYVLPNMVIRDPWDHPERFIADHPLRIGLTGSKTHQEDWRVLETVLPRLLQQHPNVELLVAGFQPDYLREIPNAIFLEPLPYDAYAEVVRSCDIILAPVDPDDAFNNSKSPIKVIEGMAASRPVGSALGGAACIATRNKVYPLAIRDGENGLLVNQTSESWYTALERLIADEALRHRLQWAGHKWVWKRHDIGKTWVQWSRAYQDICARPVNSTSLPLVS